MEEGRGARTPSRAGAPGQGPVTAGTLRARPERRPVTGRSLTVEPQGLLPAREQCHARRSWGFSSWRELAVREPAGGSSRGLDCRPACSRP